MARSTTLTTYARIIAKDHLTGPLRAMQQKIAATQTRFTKMQQATAKAGRKLVHSSGGFGSAAAAGGAFALIRNEYEFQKAMNATQATLTLNETQLEKHRRVVLRLAKQFPATSAEIAKGAKEIGMTGAPIETVNAVLEGAIKAHMASGETIKDVAIGITDVILASGQAWQTLEQQKRSFAKTNDLLAYGQTKWSQDYAQLLQGLRKAAPIGNAAKMSIEGVTVMLGIMANAGFKASVGGTAFASSLLRLAAPTKKMREMFRGLGIDLSKFLHATSKFKNRGAVGLIDNLAAELGVNPDQLGALKPAIDKILNNKNLTKDANKLGAALRKVIIEGLDLSKDNVEGRKTVAQLIQRYVQASFSSINILGLMRAIANKNVADLPAALSVIFGKRHAAKMRVVLKALVGDVGKTIFDAMLGDIKKNAPGAADRMAETLMKGLPGALARLSSAFDAMVRSLADTGFWGGFIKAIDTIRDGINAMNGASPGLMKLAGTMLFVTGAMAPLGLAFSGIAAAMTPFTVVLGALASGTASIIGFGAAAGLAVPRIIQFAKRLPVMFGAIIAGKKAIPILGSLRTALMFGGAGVAIAAVTAGLVAIGRNLESIQEFGSGFGKGFMKGWLDQPTVDANGNLDVMEGTLSKIKNLMKALFGGKTDADTLTKAFQSGERAGKGFADMLGTAAVNAEKLVKNVQKLHQLLPNVWSKGKAGDGQRVDSHGNTVPEYGAPGSVFRKDGSLKLIPKYFTDIFKDEKSVPADPMRKLVPANKERLDHFRKPASNDNAPRPATSGKNVVQMPSQKPMTGEEWGRAFKQHMASAPPRKLDVEVKSRIEVDGNGTVKENKVTTKERGATAPSPRTSNGGRS